MLGDILEAVKSSVIEFFINNPQGTVKELFKELNLTQRAIEKQIASLKLSGKLDCT